MTERRLARDAFAAEAAAPVELVDALATAGAIEPDAQGAFGARDEVIVATAQALLDAGIALDDLVAMLIHQRFGMRAIGHIFSEPPARTEATWAELAADADVDLQQLMRAYAALGLPEPDPGTRPRADEAELLLGFLGMWDLVDPSGNAHVRVARIVGESTRRVAEGWLDVWDEVARPDATTQGAPTVGTRGRPADPGDPEQNLSIRMAELGRGLVSLVHELHLQTTLNARILSLLERLLGEAGRLPPRSARPPAIAFVDLSGFTSLTESHGDEAAAVAAIRLQELAEEAVREESGRVVKQLGDGVLMRLPASDAAIRVVRQIMSGAASTGLPAPHAGIAAGPVIVRDGDVFGRTVNLAARLAARAGPGEVLVEEGVVVVLPRGTARFEALGRLELPGFAEPVAVWRADTLTPGA